MTNRASFRVRSFGSSACLRAALEACTCGCEFASGSPIAAAVTANPAVRKTSRRSVSFMAGLRLCKTKIARPRHGGSGRGHGHGSFKLLSQLSERAVDRIVPPETYHLAFFRTAGLAGVSFGRPQPASAIRTFAPSTLVAL